MAGKLLQKRTNGLLPLCWSGNDQQLVTGIGKFHKLFFTTQLCKDGSSLCGRRSRIILSMKYEGGTLNRMCIFRWIKSKPVMTVLYTTPEHQ